MIKSRGAQAIDNPVRAVFLGDAKSVFVHRTVDALSARGFDIVVIDPTSCRVNGRLRSAFRTLEAVLATERDRTAVIHSLSPNICWLAPLLKSRFRRVVGIAYGSDVLRRNKRYELLFRFGLRRLDAFASTNDNVMQAAIKDFPVLVERERSIVRFGLPVFDALDRLLAGGVTPQRARLQLGYAPERALVSLGYSASPGQRQIELIDYLSTQLRNCDGLDFVVPAQYGDPNVIAETISACDRGNSGFPRNRFHPLVKFHDIETSALMRLATSVLINNSTTDAFSGTVQEVVYAGNLVLAGEHLPYRQMPGFRSAIRPYASLSDCMEFLTMDSLARWSELARSQHEATRQGLRDVSSWDAVEGDWRSLISPSAEASL